MQALAILTDSEQTMITTIESTTAAEEHHNAMMQGRVLPYRVHDESQ